MPGEGATTGTTTPQQLLAQLDGTATEQACAYATLEACQDAEVGIVCVAKLAAQLADPSQSAETHTRCCLVLAHLCSLDPVRFAGVWLRDMRCLSTRAPGNAVDVVLCSDAVGQMTKEDARTVAAIGAWYPAMFAPGYDAVCDVNEIGVIQWKVADISDDNAFNRLKKDEGKAMHVATRLLDMLREDRAQVSDAEVAGTWWILQELSEGGGSLVCLHIVQQGAVELAIEELRRGSPSEWVSIAQTPSGKFGAVLDWIRCATYILTNAQHKQTVAATPGLLDVLLDLLHANEQANDPADSNLLAVIAALYGLGNAREAFIQISASNETAIRGAASGIRFVLDHPQPFIKEVGISTNASAVRNSI
eukprot:COSAG02_NODE_4431_length_5366_cov_9.496298_2_plen_363_part_00